VVGYDDSNATMKSFQIVLVLRVLRLLRLMCTKTDKLLRGALETGA